MKYTPMTRIAIILCVISSLLFVCGNPLNFVIVDPVLGNDSNCQSILIDSTTSAEANLLPCKTIDNAILVLNVATNVANTSSWLHMRLATYQVSNLVVPIPFVTFSSHLPPLPSGTNYSFPASLSTNNSRVTWDCMNSQNCIRSSVPGLTIEGVSFRNVQLHAIRHVGTMEQTTDLTLIQVDCRDSGGLLYKSNGSVSLSQVELVNATNYPLAVGFQSSVSLVHFINSNVSITDSHFRDNQINGSFKSPSSAMSIVSPSTFVSFTMLRTEFRNNFFQTTLPPPKGADSKYCTIGPGILFNVSFINIKVDSCDFADNTGYGDHVCGGGISVFPFADPDPTHSIDLQISSSRFWNNSILKTSSSDGVGILVDSSLAATAPVISITNCTFLGHTGSNHYFGGIVGLRRSKMVSITDSYFTGNTIIGVKLFDIGFSGSVLLQNSIFDGNQNPCLTVSIMADLTIKDSVFSNGIGVASAGAAILYGSDYAKTAPQVTIDGCLFANNSGGEGGGVTLSSVTADISLSNFTGNYGHEGGAACFLGSTVNVNDCLFSSNYVMDEFFNYLSGNPAQGGAVFAVTSSVTVQSSRFINSTYQSPNGIQACESASRGTIVSAFPRGGAFSLFQSSLNVEDSYFEKSFACIGGDISANGEAVYLMDTTISSSRAMLGGSVAMREGVTFFTYNAVFENVSAVSNGGALSFSTVNQVRISESTFDNVQSVTGDGGVIYLSVMSTQAGVTADGTTFSNCSAPAGGGGLSFSSSIDGGVVLSFYFTDEEGMNTIIPPDGSYVEWGEIEATNVVLITSNVQALNLYPGQPFYESVHATAFNISIFAFDMFNQTVRGNRGMVIQCSLQQKDGQSPLSASVSGTVLQQMTSARAAAEFGDLIITAVPGEYQLVFSVVGTSSIPSITIPVSIRSECPGSLFYKNGVCTSCPNSLLVYDSSTNNCVACESGRVATSDGKCAICDLGYTNYGSPSCVKCTSNTYQPAPMTSCVSCVGSEMDGISCSNGLEVQPGYFAFSVFLSGSSYPSIQTVQCPEGYCTGAPLQSNWSDPMNRFINGSASTVVPDISSAVTRFDQCAYPRLSAEDNYLCGACAPGLIVWGSKCSKCDHLEGGRMTLFIFLSFALVIFLVRASMATASAGHTTILLYFIQTAMLEIGSSSNLVGWLNVGLLSPSSFSDCVAPLDVYQQSTFQLLMPLFLLGELLIVMTLHYMWFRSRFQGGTPPPNPASSQDNQYLASTFDLRSRFLSVIDSFSIDLYISAALSVLLFTYTQVMMESFRMLTCVDVAGAKVVFTQPTMRCDSDEYKRHLVLVGIVIAYVGFLPLAISLFLWRNKNLVQMSHELMKLEDPTSDSNMSEYLDSSSSSSSSIQKSVAPSTPKPMDEVVPHFLLRYSAVFSMYSSSAWFWKGILLSRRIVFAAISVSLVRRPNMKFFAFGFAHLVSLLLQGYFRPFERDFFNWMEVASHVVLILLSQSLTAILPPYSDSTQAYLFVLVILPICIYALVVLIERYMSHRSLRSIEQIIFARGSIVAGMSEAPKNLHNHPMSGSQLSSSAQHPIIASPSSTDESAVEMNHVRHSNGDKSGAVQDSTSMYAESQHVLPLDVKRSESIVQEDSAVL